MHVSWSFCQAASFFERKTNQLEQFKKEESTGAQGNKHIYK